MLLHGDLQVRVMDTENLPTIFRRNLPKLRICLADTFDEPQTSTSHDQTQRKTRGTYVAIHLAGARVVRTRAIRSSENPVWNQNFKFPVAHLVSEILFHIKDNNMFLSKLVGIAIVPAEMVARGEIIHQWFRVRGPHTHDDAAIRLQISYMSTEMNSIYENGFSENYQVQQSYFPLRRGGRLTLFQDAHITDGSLPEIRIDEGISYEHGKCWEEICRAMIEARDFIYILGWSVYHKVVLVREPASQLYDDESLNLGELLKKKSEQGVRVLMLIWKDKTSFEKFFGKSTGIMKAHDKETRKFFKNSTVRCLLAPRFTNSTFRNFKEQTLRALYSQHQKCVIMDTQGDANNRKLTAFLGGLDLCDGRYDTPEHRLYRDRDTVFKDDFHNPSAVHHGPREPWHDLHCKLEGPAAHDVLTNFEQRWRKASEWAETRILINRMLGWEKHVLDINQIPWITSPATTFPNEDDPSLWVSNEDDPQTWHTQVFRSIDSGSLKGFPEDADAAYKDNLAFDKNLVIDRSIEMAYIQAIRSAQHFIYIENQYFIGSSYAWPSDQDAGANNLVPMELALKIASKIRARERFAVYIVIPMWPEGLTDSLSVQEILYWQRQTMKMMYAVVAQELQSSQIEGAHPTDYLNFYCLGNREEFQENEAGPSTLTSASSPSHKNVDRFMIYVHSKGMIVDDEYVMIGSANINQRSLAGSRDTEIALGAYQPHYTWNKRKDHPYGQVYGYRMSLWAEHIGVIENCFKAPDDLDCVRCVNDIAEKNWRRYTTEEFTRLQGHIIKYPVDIDLNGRVTPLPGFEKFPDYDGSIGGTHTGRLPRKLTS
ncbi:hypothetical protein ACS0TY_035897 [Phlomoides rotata]